MRDKTIDRRGYRLGYRVDCRVMTVPDYGRFLSSTLNKLNYTNDNIVVSCCKRGREDARIRDNIPYRRIFLYAFVYDITDIKLFITLACTGSRRRLIESATLARDSSESRTKTLISGTLISPSDFFLVGFLRYRGRGDSVLFTRAGRWPILILFFLRRPSEGPKK